MELVEQLSYGLRIEATKISGNFMILTRRYLEVNCEEARGFNIDEVIGQRPVVLRQGLSDEIITTQTIVSLTSGRHS